jgi:hypothetical protein
MLSLFLVKIFNKLYCNGENENPKRAFDGLNPRVFFFFIQTALMLSTQQTHKQEMLSNQLCCSQTSLSKHKFRFVFEVI